MKGVEQKPTPEAQIVIQRQTICAGDYHTGRTSPLIASSFIHPLVYKGCGYFLYTSSGSLLRLPNKSAG